MKNKRFWQACLLLSVFSLAQSGCAAPAPKSKKVKVSVPVVVIANKKSDVSMKIAQAYRQAHQLLPEQIITIDCLPTEEIFESAYKELIEMPVKKRLEETGLKDQIKYIVTTKGIPMRFQDGANYSVDAFLMTMYLDLKPMPQNVTANDLRRCLNPYFKRKEAFDYKSYNFYLAARLDGYTLEDALALIDRAKQAKPLKGPFLIDYDPQRNGEGYKQMNETMVKANETLTAKGLNVRFDQTKEFIGSMSNLAGYYSWGSNDKSYDKTRYNSLRFAPGAIAETCVSTSAHTFNKPKSPWWQSLIGDLIEQGVTGVKGYVSEPYSVALCPADVLFDRYTSGYTLGESFWMATPLLKWKDVVIGDPLCAPYAKTGSGKL